MNNSSLSESIKTGIIFAFTYLILLATEILTNTNNYISTNSYNEKSLMFGRIFNFIIDSSWLILILILFLALFIFLFKQQRKSIEKRFRKPFLFGALAGLIIGVGLLIFVLSTASGEGIGSGAFVFLSLIPIISLITAFIFYIMFLNVKYMTNLLIVVYSISATTIIQFVCYNFLKSSEQLILFITPFGFLIGTILAIISKKMQKRS